MLDAAIAYVAWGWHVVPLHSWTGDVCTCGRERCSSPAKHPRSPHGLKDASADAAQVAEWWTRWPSANVGLLTGVSFDVLDVDGDEGLQALEQTIPIDAPTCDGPSATTGRGYHVYVAPTGLGNRARLLDHVDWRGKGGYVVAPPSLHASGRRYEWAPGWAPEHVEIRPAPAWLLDLLRSPAPAPAPARPPAGLPGSPRSEAYGRRALEAEAGKVALAPEGSRNDTLNRAALSLGQLVGRGVLSFDEVVNVLLVAAARAGLGDAEARRTMASGLRAGLARPRRVGS